MVVLKRRGTSSKERGSRNARRDDFEIANTFVPAGTHIPPRADLELFKTGSCGAHLCLELGAVGSDGMGMTAILRATATFAFLAPMRSACLLPSA